MSVRRPARGMWPKLSLWEALGLSLLFAGLCIAFVDRPVALAVEAAPETVRHLARLLSAITDPVLVLPVLVAGLVTVAGLRLRQGPSAEPALGIASVLALCGVSATLLSLALKSLVGRAWPSLADQFDPFIIQPFAFDDRFGSMPSSQAALAGAMALSVSILFPRMAWPARLVGLSVCASRVLVGEHWLSDTVLGWALGLAVTVAVCRLTCPRRKSRRRSAVRSGDASKGLQDDRTC